MHKKLKNLIKITKVLFSLEYIDEVSRKSKFVQRKSKLTAKDFLAFTVFSSEDMCTAPLAKLCAKLESTYGVSISPQALNERFNKYSVEFMKEVFNDMLAIQNKILQQEKKTLELNFDRIIINDATSFKLPKEYKEIFKGSGGSAYESGIKIQLQYELLSGQFMCCDIGHGSTNDADYLNTMEKYARPGDLKLADLGYFKVEYLKKIDTQKAFFISKLKSNSNVYMENPNPERYKNGNIKKSTKYLKVDIQSLVKPLAEGETIELLDIYIGKNKDLKIRLIITKLTEENKEKREIKHKKEVKKGRGTLNEKSIDWCSINVYITNVPIEMLSKEQIHDIYSLRWSIELMFKIWKSLFDINKVKKVKIERFKCFLYGRLIALLLTSGMVFTARDIIYDEENKEISEIKSFGIVEEYLPNLSMDIFKGEFPIMRLLRRIIDSIKKLGIKSKRKGRKTSFTILNSIRISEGEMEKLAS